MVGKGIVTKTIFRMNGRSVTGHVRRPATPAACVATETATTPTSLPSALHPDMAGSGNQNNVDYSKPAFPSMNDSISTDNFLSLC